MERKLGFLLGIFLLIAITLSNHVLAVSGVEGTNVSITTPTNETLVYGNTTITATIYLGVSIGVGNMTLYYDNQSSSLAWVHIDDANVTNSTGTFTWNTGDWEDAHNYTLNVSVYNSSGSAFIMDFLVYNISVDSASPNISSISFTSPTESSTNRVTFTTNETATCRWDMVDVSYGDMRNNFGGATKSQSTDIRGLDSIKTHTVYVRCIDNQDNADSSSTTLSIVRQGAFTEETQPDVTDDEKGINKGLIAGIVISIIIILIIIGYFVIQQK